MSLSEIEATQAFGAFLAKLSNALTAKDITSIDDLFLPQGYLRDILISEWNFNSIPKADGQLKAFFEEKGVPEVTNLRTDDKKTAPVYVDAAAWIQGFIRFETPIAIGEGFIRLQKDASGEWKAFTLSFILDHYKQYPELAGPDRPVGTSHSSDRGGPKNWLDLRNETINNPNPQVLIVGAAHSGLMVAARLKRLGVHTLLVDKLPNIGDTWRNRYHSLVLHDVVWGNHFPYIKYPEDFPIFLPKDKLADWMESYAKINEFNFWGRSTIVPNSTSYNESTGTWSVKVDRNGTTVDVTCHHIIQATGAFGDPSVPKFKGAENFKGPVVHSSGFAGAEGWKGKKVVVIGGATSAHDICQELYNGGVDVTMVQRNPTLVITSKTGVKMLLEPLYMEGGPPTEEADLAGISFPVTATLPYAIKTHQAICDAEKPLLDGLKKSGFRIGGDGGPGLLVQFYSRGGGYYIDVGASQLIIDGKIKVKPDVGVAEIEEKGVRFTDGSYLDADMIVLCTGYRSMVDTCRTIFGSQIADKTGPVWGLDKQGELQGLWRNSGHPHFWYMAGNFITARPMSKYLALQIKAVEEGLYTQ